MDRFHAALRKLDKLECFTFTSTASPTAVGPPLNATPNVNAAAAVVPPLINLEFVNLTHLNFIGFVCAAPFVLAFARSTRLQHVSLELSEVPTANNRDSSTDPRNVIVQLVDQHLGHLKTVNAMCTALQPGGDLAAFSHPIATGAFDATARHAFSGVGFAQDGHAEGSQRTDNSVYWRTAMNACREANVTLNVGNGG